MKRIFFTIIIGAMFSQSASAADLWFRMTLWEGSQKKSVYLKRVRLLDYLETNHYIGERSVLPLSLLPEQHRNTFNAVARLIQNRLPNPNILQQEQILNHLGRLLNDYIDLETNEHFVPEIWFERQLQILDVWALVAPPGEETDVWEGFTIAAEAERQRELLRQAAEQAAEQAVIDLAEAREQALDFRREQEEQAWRRQQRQQFQQSPVNRPRQPGRSTVAAGNRFRGYQADGRRLLPVFFSKIQRNFGRW